MKTQSTLIILTYIFICGCGGSVPNKSSELVYNNDFEAIGQWCELPTLTKEKSNSGNFSTFASIETPYSMSFTMPWNTLKSKKIKKITAKCKYLENEQNLKAKLVVSINKDDKSILWKGAELKFDANKINKWKEGFCELSVDTIIPDDAVVKIYGWNEGGGVCFLDDFSIEFVE